MAQLFGRLLPDIENESLPLYDNLLEGTIPASLNALDEVTYFALSTNKLSGALPTFAFPRNQYFDMRYVFHSVARARSYNTSLWGQIEIADNSGSAVCAVCVPCVPCARERVGSATFIIFIYQPRMTRI